MTNYDNLDLRSNIQNTIKQYIDSNHLPFTAVGKALGLSDTTVKRWYNGVCLPDINLLPSLCKYMNISLSQLLGIENSGDLSESQLQLIEMYSTNDSFKNLVNKFRDDEEFRVTISALLKMMK